MRLAPRIALALSILCVASTAAASPESDGRKGLQLARKGECIEAMPLLESAENGRHRPETAIALADCYVTLGALLNAKVLYEVVSQEPIERSHSRADRLALASAKKKLQDIEARIPTITFKIPPNYRQVVIQANGEPVDDPTEPHPFDPGEDITFTISAAGRKPRKETLNLAERERRVFPVELETDGKQNPSVPPSNTRFLLGVAYRGYLLPRFLTNIFGEGGRTVVAPGAGLSFTRVSGPLELTFGLDYNAFFMGPTPFKPNGTPDTEYEIIESDLSALQATLELRWNIPLDARKRVRFRIGAGLGLGWTFAGNLYRTQAYSPTFTPNDPYAYLPCPGPNNPPGSFRYCNQLTKDADRYPGYTEPSWFEGGVRPLIYPWIALPLVGLSVQPTPRLALDLDLAPTITGLLTSAGVRVAF